MMRRAGCCWRELAWLSAAGWLALQPACGGGKLATRSSPGEGLGTTPQRDVVSRVGESAILASEVDSLARVGAMPPRAALARLQAERLLAQVAQERGYAQSGQTRLAARQALVQALLARDVETEQPSEAAVESAYLAQHERFEQPEQRRATHVLAELRADASPQTEQAARAFIEQALRQLRDAADPQAVLAALKEERNSSFRVLVQELPLAKAQGVFVPEFSQALFSVPRPGVVPEPVRTQFGYHAIVVTEIVPASSTPRSEALQTLRAELSVHLHEKRALALLEQLRSHTPIKYAKDVAGRLAELEFRE